MKTAPILWVLLGAGVTSAGFIAHDSHSDPAAAETPAAPVNPLALDAAGQAKAGVTVATLTAGTAQGELAGLARVVDLSPLAATIAEIGTARAALGASQAEAARLRALVAADDSAPRRSLEAAQATARADAVRLELAQRRLALEIGPGLAQVDAAGLVADAARGDAALLRIDIPGAALDPGNLVRLDGGPVVRILGPAAMADPRLQTAGALAIARGVSARGLTAGRSIPAHAASGGALTGTMVPAGAIVRWQGSRWVYRQENRAFQRVELSRGQPIGGNWLATGDVKPGDRVAVTGAASLLAIETAPAGGEEE